MSEELEKLEQDYKIKESKIEREALPHKEKIKKFEE